MANIFKLYSDGVIQGTDSDDSIVLLVSNSATIYGDSTGGSSNFTFSYPFIGPTPPDQEDINGINNESTYYINPIMPKFGNDQILVGAGNVTVYGDAGSLSINVIGPSPNTDNTLPVTTGAAWVKLVFPTVDPINNAAVQFGNDTILTGIGNATVVGDVGEQDITCSIAPSSGTYLGTAVAGAYIGDSDLNGGFPYDGLSIHFGNDTIIAGYGVDSLYGDVMNMVHSCLGGVNEPNGFSNTSILALYTFGNDTIIGGNLSNLIVGDIGKYDIEMIAGSNSAWSEAHYDMKATFGNDTLIGGTGTNAIYGDIQNWLMNFHGADNLVGSALQFPSISEGEADNSIFMMGSDKITSYGTNDNLVGDVGTWTYNATAGINGNVGGSAVAENMADVVDASQIQFGNDVITEGGNGTAHLYGDVQTINMNFQGGVNAQGSASGFIGLNAMAGLGAILIHSAGAENPGYAPYNLPITFGNDTLTAGSGNDTLYGDGDTWNITAKAGTASGKNADVSVGLGESVNFGSNTLIGGSGNDTEYGSFKTLNFHLVDGTANGNVSGVDAANNVYALAQLAGTIAGTDGPSGSNVTGFHFGNNILIAGTGNQTLIGDVGTFEYFHTNSLNQTVLDSFFQNITWGNNILVAGAGNDILTGGVGTFIDNQGVTTAGGNNQFVFDGHIHNGKDTITDFHTALDTLVGQDGATFQNGGHDAHGNVIVDVLGVGPHNQSSTVTLLGVHNFSDIHITLAATPVVIV